MQLGVIAQVMFCSVMTGLQCQVTTTLAARAVLQRVGGVGHCSDTAMSFGDRHTLVLALPCVGTAMTMAV